MDTIKVKVFSQHKINQQPLCGLYMLRDRYDVQWDCELPKEHNYNLGISGVRIEYRGCTIWFDTDDGYQNLERIAERLNNCDFYFKSNLSKEKNKQIAKYLGYTEDSKSFEVLLTKMYTLGLHYCVTYLGSPSNRDDLKHRWAFRLLGMKQEGGSKKSLKF